MHFVEVARECWLCNSKFKMIHFCTLRFSLWHFNLLLSVTFFSRPNLLAGRLFFLGTILCECLRLVRRSVATLFQTNNQIYVKIKANKISLIESEILPPKRAKNNVHRETMYRKNNHRQPNDEALREKKKNKKSEKKARMNKTRAKTCTHTKTLIFFKMWILVLQCHHERSDKNSTVHNKSLYACHEFGFEFFCTKFFCLCVHCWSKYFMNIILLHELSSLTRWCYIRSLLLLNAHYCDVFCSVFFFSRLWNMRTFNPIIQLYGSGQRNIGKRSRLQFCN